MLRIPCINRCAIVIHSMLHTLCLSAFVSSVRIGDNVLCKSVLITQITHTQNSAAAMLHSIGRHGSLACPSARVKRHAAALRLSMLHACTVITGKVATSCPDPRTLYIHHESLQYILFMLLNPLHILYLSYKCVNNNLE